jgi:hypothetical protein
MHSKNDEYIAINISKIYLILDHLCLYEKSQPYSGK